MTPKAISTKTPYDLIRELVLESSRDFDPVAARTEILKRSGKFLKELSAEGLFPFHHDDEWQDFCARWRISPNWNGDLVDLEKKIVPLEIMCRRSSAQMKPAWKSEGPKLRQWSIYPRMKGDWGGADQRGDDWAEIVQREDAFVYIRIDPWTTLQEIQFYWLEIQHQQKAVYGFDLERAKPKFFMHLCWYDLVHGKEKYGKISHAKIARDWKKWGGKGKYSKSAVTESIKGMSKIIGRATIL